MQFVSLGLFFRFVSPFINFQTFRREPYGTAYIRECGLAYVCLNNVSTKRKQTLFDNENVFLHRKKKIPGYLEPLFNFHIKTITTTIATATATIESNSYTHTHDYTVC